MTARAIHSYELLRALSAAGIIPQREVYRVVIDAKVDDLVRIYVECFGADDILQVITPTNLSEGGTKVTILEGKQVESSSIDFTVESPR